MAHIRQVQPFLLPCETYLCVDGGLTRKKRIDAVCDIDLLIGKLGCDAHMRYLYQGPKRPGRGRQNVFDGQVDWTNLSRLDYVGADGAIRLYTAYLNHLRFQRTLRVVVLIQPDAEPKAQSVILLSTDDQLAAWKIYRYYKACFQIEFLFRDSKQFTGLADGQVRTADRVDFHFNAALTTLNLAKAELMDQQPDDQLAICSLARLKAEYFNQYYLDRIISIFGFDPKWLKKRPEYHHLKEIGRIAA